MHLKVKTFRETFSNINTEPLHELMQNILIVKTRSDELSKEPARFKYSPPKGLIGIKFTGKLKLKAGKSSA